ncbi:MAG: DUF2065 family protein [Rhodobacteraceae bacterium]|nr:DUF2065 family protein [Paracoccaceae bacterium]
MGWLFLGLGLVLVLEGLVFALAPSRLDDILEMMRAIPPETRRLIGLAAVALGVCLVAVARMIGV